MESNFVPEILIMQNSNEATLLADPNPAEFTGSYSVETDRLNCCPPFFPDFDIPPPPDPFDFMPHDPDFQLESCPLTWPGLITDDMVPKSFVEIMEMSPTMAFVLSAVLAFLLCGIGAIGVLLYFKKKGKLSGLLASKSKAGKADSSLKGSVEQITEWCFNSMKPPAGKTSVPHTQSVLEVPNLGKAMYGDFNPMMAPNHSASFSHVLVHSDPNCRRSNALKLAPFKPGSQFPPLPTLPHLKGQKFLISHYAAAPCHYDSSNPVYEEISQSSTDGQLPSISCTSYPQSMSPSTCSCACKTDSGNSLDGSASFDGAILNKSAVQSEGFVDYPEHFFNRPVCPCSDNLTRKNFPTGGGRESGYGTECGSGKRSYHTCARIMKPMHYSAASVQGFSSLRQSQKGTRPQKIPDQMDSNMVVYDSKTTQITNSDYV